MPGRQGAFNRSEPIAVQLTVLGSGSSGNATLVAYGSERVLVDAGLSYRELTRRLEAIRVDPGTLRAILVTHAHGDHTRSAALLSRRHGVPVYMTPSTREAWGERAMDIAKWEQLSPGRPVELSALTFLPFAVPHDAAETLAFRIDTPEGAIGLATDVGSVTPELASQLRGCCLVVIESNHAVDLLRMSPYAASVKTRIGGDEGHLSNEALAGFIVEHLGDTVRCLVLAHLSRVNNVPELAEMTCREALARRGRHDVRVVVATQDRAAPTIDLGSLAPVVTAATAAAITARQRELPFV